MCYSEKGNSQDNVGITFQKIMSPELKTNIEISKEELTECDRDALHLIGSIQGNCGNCLFVDIPEWSIIAVDAKIFDLKFISLEVGGEDATKTRNFIGNLLKDHVPNDLYGALHENVKNLMKSRSSKSYLFYDYQGCGFAISVSSPNSEYSTVAFEIETLNTDIETSAMFQTYVSMSSLMESYSGANVVENACDRVFELFGHYDRGMVYRFNDDDSGEVIHERKRDYIETSYLGLRFPSSDIPKPSRRLYFINRVRYIHNNELDPIQIIARNNITIDQSLCHMRAVAKPHVLYLKQMGVVSSLSMAIIVDEKLWGLLSFHAYTNPYKPSLQQRLACESIGAMVSVRVEAAMKKIESSRSLLLGQQVSQLDKKKCVNQNMSDWGTALLSIIKADVFVGYTENVKGVELEYLVLGNAALKPGKGIWKKLRQLQSRELVVSSCRSEISALGLSKDECPACGFVYYRESRTHFFFGRSERSSDVCWGGNPDEPKLKINGILCPRQSFDTYIQIACVEAKRWTKEDLNVISILRDRLCEHCHDWNMTLLENDIELSNQKYMAAVQRAQDNYEFFAHMSHELRTPFHGVMGCLSLLCESLNNELNPDSMDLLHTALASGNHMLNLLNDILKISKSNHLSHDVLQETLSFQKMAVQLVNTMKPFAMTRGITITSDIAPGNSDCIIGVDNTKITQIVSNCVNNAIKFAPYGSTINMQITLSNSICDSMHEWRKKALLHAGHVFFPYDGNMLYDSNTIDSWLKREASDPKDLWLMILISDSGCGMKSVELSAMFAPYTQSSCGSNRNFQGTGLGLYICVSLCHLLHGFIACASTPDKGTTFAIGIPVRQEMLHDSSQSPNATQKEELENTCPIHMTGGILIADDNKVNVKILKRNIEIECKKSGKVFDIFCAFGGEEAVELYKMHHPSMCFIDYHMPDVDGILATKQIRAIEAEQQLPHSYILSYTADATLEARGVVLASGANDIMTKPPPKGMVPNLINRMEKKLINCLNK